jgi:N-acetyl-1-D-myo-inositol-2-amino-2-deoxy-alpha-D-glucopyranoside deacetylase
MTSGALGLLLVHAHPDDESINNGVTMAACAEHGTPVTLVTCTRGEEGEVIPPSLAALAADRDDALGPHRAGELAAAMAALGVTDHRFLGGDRDRGRWRDSGMLGVPQNDRPDAFWQAAVDEAARELAGVIRETRPATLITYDPQGGYGHPDHVQAHRVATRAAELAAGPGPDGEPGHRITRVLWNCVPRSAAEEALARLRAAGPGRFPGIAELTDIPGVVDDAEVALAVTGTPGQAAAKTAAMRAHATQVEVPEPTAAGPAFALSNALLQPLWTTEYYRLAAGEPFGPGAGGPFRPFRPAGGGSAGGAR